MFNFLGAKKQAAADPTKPPISGVIPTAANAGAPANCAAISPEDAERALEALGAVLRAMGTHAFDVDDQDSASIKHRFSRWAEHVLVAAPLEADKERPADPSSRRDWASVRRLVLAHRKREAAFVVKTTFDLREVIWSFVNNVTRAAVQDDASGKAARDRLTTLRSALAQNDIEALRREVSETATAIESVLDEQHARQAMQLEQFATSVRKLGEELEGAKREGALDPLTRIHNRACFDEVLGRTVGLSSLFCRSSYLLMIDVDKFKTVNDTYGHPGGDAVIKAVADCLVRTFPRRDDLVARYGGDEFAVILKEIDPKDAGGLAERLVTAARGLRVAHQGREIEVTLSVGIAPCHPGDSTDVWLARTDAALYQAKANGRNGWAAPPELDLPNALSASIKVR